MNENNFEMLAPVPFEGRDIEATVNFNLKKILTDNYLKLLNNYKKAILFNKGAKFKAPENIPCISTGYVTVILLYGVSDDSNGLNYRIDFYSSILPSGFYPLGDCPGGNQICVKESTGEIYFWWHESISDDKCFYFLSDSVDTFINGLIPDENDDNSDDVTQKIVPSGTWLNF